MIVERALASNLSILTDAVIWTSTRNLQMHLFQIHALLHKELEMEPFYIGNLTLSGESK